MRLRLCTFDEDLATAWRLAFAQEPSVIAEVGDILQHNADAIISPAKSFGFMDGGIDLAYSHFFGWGVEERLRARINSDFAGELPVGCALVIPTESHAIPYLVSAPTMRVPSRIHGTANTYLAFRAALLAIRQHNQQAHTQIASVLVPGLGAGVGMVPPNVVARQMAAAFREVERGETAWRSTAKGVLAQHRGLLEE